MSGASYIYAGVARAGPGTRGGVFRRQAGELEWRQLGDGLPEDTQVQAITLLPGDQATVYLGTHDGPYRSTDRGEHWERPDFPRDGTQVWSILVDPVNPRVLYAGTSPVGVFRSDDCGDHWRPLATPALPERVKMEFPCRVMRLASEPGRPGALYATLEVGGAMRSLDGGESWQDCSEGLIELAQRPHLKSMIQSDTDIEGMMDGHALCVSAAAPGSVFLAVRMGLFRSDDRGSSWQDMEVGRYSPLTYSRDVRVSPQDPSTLYLCLSPAARSQDGSLYRSEDLGQSWQRFDHGIRAEATMMAVALHPDDPSQVHCASRCGQVFSTTDAGKSWQETRLPQGARDLYAVACGS
jgi:photosystem II stability/assembly factor-like uncharacterized protein